MKAPVRGRCRPAGGDGSGLGATPEAIVRAVAGLAILGALGCTPEVEGAPRTDRVEGHAAVGGDVASTVDGFPIRVADVARVIAETDLDADQALRRLEDFELLAAEAERRGEGRRRSVEETARQSMTQHLLEEAERAVTPASVSDQDVMLAWRTERGAEAPEPTEADREALRAELVRLRRFAWVRELVNRLEAERGVERNPTAIEAMSHAPLQAGDAP